MTPTIRLSWYWRIRRWCRAYIRRSEYATLVRNRAQRSLTGPELVEADRCKALAMGGGR